MASRDKYMVLWVNHRLIYGVNKDKMSAGAMREKKRREANRERINNNSWYSNVYMN